MNANTSLKIFKFFAWVIGIYHIVLGMVGTLATAGLIGSTVSLVYGLTPNVDSQFLVAARFAGTYILAFGVMMVLVANKPKEYKAFIWPAVILFATRLFDRIFYFSTIKDAFNSSMSENWITIILLIVFGGSLIIFRPQE